MRHVFSAVFFLTMISCAPKDRLDPRTIRGIDPVFDHYVSVYKMYKGEDFYYDIPIQFVDKLEGNTIGVCTRWSSGFRQIEIEREYWFSSTTSESERMGLIAHELGHCDLNRDHDNRSLPSGAPASFMSEWDFSYAESMEYYYFSELFDP